MNRKDEITSVIDELQKGVRILIDLPGRVTINTEEYRKFYLIARNLSTQSINIDKTSVFFYGVLKNDKKSNC